MQSNKTKITPKEQKKLNSKLRTPLQTIYIYTTAHDFSYYIDIHFWTSLIPII